MHPVSHDALQVWNRLNPFLIQTLHILIAATNLIVCQSLSATRVSVPLDTSWQPSYTLKYRVRRVPHSRSAVAQAWD